MSQNGVRPVNNQDGFTLIEVLIAVTILGIGFAVLINGFTGVLVSNERSSDYLYVVSWADKKLIKVTNDIELNRHGSFEYKNKRFDWWIEEGYLETDLKKITLKVEWKLKNNTVTYSQERLVLVDS